MSYTARFSNAFLKKHQKLPSNIRPRVTGLVKEILTNPYSGVMLVGPLRGLWKAKVGKYRLLYEIEEKEKVVVFHDIELRKKIYNR